MNTITKITITILIMALPTLGLIFIPYIMAEILTGLLFVIVAGTIGICIYLILDDIFG